MKTSAKLEVRLLVDACKRVGITKMVLSPGSRNAPISIAFDEDPHFEVLVVPDERVAAFFALGMAQQLTKPVAIACTSGSAPLNYYPAVAEAFYQQVPLVIITADRPVEWIDQGDGQTIRQEHVFGNHVVASAQLNPIHHASQRWMFERQLSETLQQANGVVKGPVHLNIPFSEPLYETTDSQETLNNWIHLAQIDAQLSANDRSVLRELWSTHPKRLIIVGQTQKNQDLQKVLEELVSDGSVAVLVEHTSNVQHPYFVQCIDRALNILPADDLQAYRPDVIVSVGGAIISKRIKRFLRESHAPVIKFGAAFPFMDTFQQLNFTSTVNEVTGLRFLCELTSEKRAVTRFGFKWKELDYRGEVKLREVMPTIPYSDLKVMETILDIIPDNTHIHISNSSMIRYALLFDPVKSMTYWCNRGTSGIDGSSSTACGAAWAEQEQCHVLVTGDLSFFYDSNAFWNVQLPENLRVIVVNNGGGDIFNIIPGPSSTAQHERIFLAQHRFKAEHICKAFELEYFSADSLASLDAQWFSFFEVETGGRPKVMEIHTAEVNNSSWLTHFFDACRK